MWRAQKSELGAKVNKNSQTSAVKRLLQDLKDLRENVIPTVGVVALPLEKDLFVWHCNIRGPKGTPYEGGVFHLILKFPQTYPLDPPEVTVCTDLVHPNVFGRKICLDMLNPGEEQERYIGWSSAYSVQSILIQLQSFLFEVSPTIKIEDCNKAIERASNYNCLTCPHRPLRSWPPFPSYEQESFVLLKSEIDIIKDELFCYHSKKSFEKDCLGFGISFTKNIRTGDIQDISSPLDLLGIHSFMREGIRKSAINEPFTHWVPIYINDEHGQKAFHLAKKSLSMICTGNTKEFKPEMALKVFPKLMNTMIAQIMKGQIYASIKALEGYCAFHQMFIKFLQEYPELLETCSDIVISFCKEEGKRHKDVVPSLGEFLPLLAVVTQVKWKDIAPLVTQESFDRQVMWLVRDFPSFDKEEEDASVDKERVSVTFDRGIVGNRLLMFHMYFLEHVVDPLGSSIEDMATSYSKLYGRPNFKMIEDMQQAFREIKKVKSFNDYFGRIGLPILSEPELRVLLRKSVTNSRLKGYHGVEGPKVPSPEELAEESLKHVVPLETLLIKNEATGESALHDREDEWMQLCKNRWGFSSIPTHYNVNNPWKHLYLQNNLQDMVNSLNDRPDFPLLYRTLELSAPALSQLEVTLFLPNKLKSGYHYLTGILGRLNHLISLKLTKGSNAGLGIKGCRALTKGLSNNINTLRKLDLSHAGITPECTDVLASGLLVSKNLETLILAGNSLNNGTKGITQVLWEHKGLTELDLTNCKIGASDAKDLADGLLANKKLRIVRLGKNPLLNVGLKSVIYNLAFSPSLELLDLNRVTADRNDYNSVAEALSRLFRINMTLTNLNLWQTNISASLTDETIEALGKNRSITHLDLGSVGNISANQLRALGVALGINTSLRTLILERNNITGSGFNTLYKALFYEKEKEKNLDETTRKERLRLEMLDKVKEEEKEFRLNLVELNLNYNVLGDVGKVLGQVLHAAKSLVKLDLESCGLATATGEALGLVLEENSSLKTLNLRKNSLGKEGAKALAAGLRSNQTLEVLDISGNGIGVSGARALAQMLANNHSITSLSMFSNFIDVDGAREVAKALRTNDTIKVLDLGLNRIRDKGAIALSKAVGTNASLETLRLKLNFIKAQGALALVKTVAQSNITEFALAGNQIEDETLLHVFDALKESNKDTGFDLASRVALLDPERVTRTIWITPLAGNTTTEQVKKLLYDNHCGVVLSVSLHDHKNKTGSMGKYAFVEFAHQNSVSLALDLSSRGQARICRQKVNIYRVGTQNKQLEGGKSSGSTSKPVDKRGGSGFGRGQFVSDNWSV